MANQPTNLKARLNPKKKPANGGPTFNVTVPEVKVPESVVNVDTQAFADALESLAIAINQLGQQQASIMQQIVETNLLIADVAKNPPQAIMPSNPRPREFDIVFVEDDEGVVGMKVRANLPN